MKDTECTFCGKMFDYEEVVTRFENKYEIFYGDYVIGDACWKCAVQQYNDTIKYDLEAEREEEYEEDDEEDMEEGCRACGNPDYPDCMTSCSMFED